MLDFHTLSKEDVTSNLKSSASIRGLDLLISGFGLLLLLPVLLLIAVVTKLTSTGPILFLTTRIGKNGRLFKLYEFRVKNWNAQDGLAHSQHDFTPAGDFLFRTKLNKLPQLINVLRGEMSMVGPRPENPKHIAFYTPWQCQALTVRPGMVSPAWLYYREKGIGLVRTSLDTVYRDEILPHKLSLELAYLQQQTVWTDLYILLQVIGRLLAEGIFVDLIVGLRNRHFFALDIVAFLLTPTLALTLRMDGLDWWPKYGPALLFFILVSLFVKESIFYCAGCIDAIGVMPVLMI